jgi:hypothetical protein
VFGFAWAFGITWVIFTVAKRFMTIRVSPDVEREGLDVPEFGALCYPDFVMASATIGHAAGEQEPTVPTTTPLTTGASES